MLKRFLPLACTALIACMPLTLAAAPTSLFINMTTDEGHRSSMAIGFGSNQLQRGHGLTIFFNDKGVKVASKVNASLYPEQQKLIQTLVGKGATILVCPMCMKQYGIKEADLLAGLKVSSPELTGNAIFAEGAQTLSW